MLTGRKFCVLNFGVIIVHSILMSTLWLSHLCQLDLLFATFSDAMIIFALQISNLYVSHIFPPGLAGEHAGWVAFCQFFLSKDSLSQLCKSWHSPSTVSGPHYVQVCSVFFNCFECLRMPVNYIPSAVY